MIDWVLTVCGTATGILITVVRYGLFGKFCYWLHGGAYQTLYPRA